MQDEYQREELLKRAKSGDSDARNQFLTENIGLVNLTISKYFPTYSKSNYHDDLIQEGSLGLIVALDKFNESMGYKFSTYAIYWIKLYCRNYIMENRSQLKIPYYAYKLYNRVKGMDEDEKDKFLEELHIQAPTYDKIEDAVNGVSLMSDMMSNSDDDKEVDFPDINLHDDHDNDNELHDLISGAVNILDDQEKEFICYFYGIMGYPRKNISTISHLVNMKRYKVKEVINEAKRKLKQYVYSSMEESKKDKIGAI